MDFIFIHINKTGGSSIENALGLRFEHKTALEKMREVGPEQWERSFTFTVVRNPWDKVASHYHYRVMTNQTGLGLNPIGLPAWVKRAYRERDPFYFDKPRMFMPQIRWIADDSGRILVDRIARFETLQQDFADICSRIGRDASLPHLKRSVRGDYRQYYDDESVEIIANWFREDIERFDYQF
jgi:hypothetical protein